MFVVAFAFGDSVRKCGELFIEIVNAEVDEFAGPDSGAGHEEIEDVVRTPPLEVLEDPACLLQGNAAKLLSVKLDELGTLLALVSLEYHAVNLPCPVGRRDPFQDTNETV